ncbi:recombinase family protein [Lederbergia citrisecunda]|uniref:recombinase family protein n=1 Tax=Lederbergia citrisecunda TaxID=2833583 RepID=UPI003D2BDA7F
MKKTVVYTRVSSDKEEQEKSLQIQEEHYREFCQQHGFELVSVYPEVGSATSVRSRPRFIEMMIDAGLSYEENSEGTDIFRTSKNEPKFELIIVKDATRFSRNTEIGISTVNRLRDKGVVVLFENAGVRSDDPNANFILPLLFSMAENESQSMSKKIKFSKKHNAKKGIYKPARLPYGYVRNSEKEIVIDEEQAEVIRYIFDSYSEKGSHLLTKELNKRGIPTQGGLEWSGDKILRIISNKIYTGTAVVNRSKKKNVTDTKRYDVPKENWIEIENAVPPIISFNQWKEMNNTRKKRVNQGTSRGRKPAINDVFYMKIYCDCCGSRFVRHQGRNNPKSKNKLLYMCQQRRNKGTGVCSIRGIAFNILDEMLDQIDVNSLYNDIADKSHYRLLMKKIDEESSSMQEKIEVYTLQIEELQKENEKITDMIVEQFTGSSQATIDALSRKIENNTSKIETIESQRAKTNIRVINTLKGYIESKMEAIEEMKTVPPNSKEWKMNLLKSVRVSEYEVSFEFNLLSLKMEIDMFNAIFPDSSIKQEVEYTPFIKTIRRDHKEAREYWKRYDLEKKSKEKGISLV